MKISSLLLTVSLVANVALVAALVLVPPATAPATAPAPRATVAAGSPTSPTATLNTADTGKPWAPLGTENLSTLIARLRAAGFPPSVLRAIVNQRFELRREELTLDGLDHPYWKSESAFRPDPKLAPNLAELERERAETLKQLFGADALVGDDSDEARIMRNHAYGNLSDEKVSQIVAAMSKIYGAARDNGPVGGAQTETFNRRLTAELSQFLTPGELLEFQMRNGPTASRLRTDLTGLNPTETEYRALFPLYQANDELFSPALGSVTPEEAAARAAAWQQMQEQIKSLLTPDRYADYLQASRPEYQQLNSLVARLNLPLSAAAQVVTVQQDIQQRASAVRVDSNLVAADRNDQLAALAQEAATKISAVIGARGLEGYKQNGGQWLTQLQPRPARTKSNSQ